MWSLDHFAFEVSDLDAAIAFYTRVLGLEVLFETRDEEHQERFAFLRLEGGNLELLQPLGPENRPSPPAAGTRRPSLCPHAAIRTPDLQAVIGRLRDAGVPLVKGPLEIPGQVRWIYISDPDGNVLEFVQWL